MRFTIYDLRFTRDLPFSLGIAGCGLAFLVLILLVTSCDKSNAKLRQPIIGTWEMGKSGEMTFDKNGNFRSKWRMGSTNGFAERMYMGNWEVESGTLEMVVTNAHIINATNFEPVGAIDRYTIVKADTTSLVLAYDRQPGITNFYTRK